MIACAGPLRLSVPQPPSSSLPWSAPASAGVSPSTARSAPGCSNQLPESLRLGLSEAARPLVIVVLAPVVAALALLALVRGGWRRALAGVFIPVAATVAALGLRGRDVFGIGGDAFPSNHAAAGLGLLVGLAVVWPRPVTRRGLVALAVAGFLIGLGNVSWYAHQPRDVVGSALLVAAVAAATFALLGGDSPNLATADVWAAAPTTGTAGPVLSSAADGAPDPSVPLGAGLPGEPSRPLEAAPRHRLDVGSSRRARRGPRPRAPSRSVRRAARRHRRPRGGTSGRTRRRAPRRPSPRGPVARTPRRGRARRRRRRRHTAPAGRRRRRGRRGARRAATPKSSVRRGCGGPASTSVTSGRAACTRGQASASAARFLRSDAPPAVRTNGPSSRRALPARRRRGAAAPK